MKPIEFKEQNKIYAKDQKMKMIIKIYLWLTRNHKWHKDWLGCLVCELRHRNNYDLPYNNRGLKERTNGKQR